MLNKEVCGIVSLSVSRLSSGQSPRHESPKQHCPSAEARQKRGISYRSVPRKDRPELQARMRECENGNTQKKLFNSETEAGYQY
jgi:hypothetical protein